MHNYINSGFETSVAIVGHSSPYDYYMINKKKEFNKLHIKYLIKTLRRLSGSD